MKKVLVVVFAVAFGLSAVANAQTPNVAVYFDEGLQFQQGVCPGAPIGTVQQNLFVVANNFGIWMNAIEYAISYPPQLAFLGDLMIPGAISIGNSPTGIAIAFPVPQNAFVQNVVQQVSVLWMCNDCALNQDAPLIVLPHPSFGLVRAVEWPNLNTHLGVGMTSLICATTPVQETTWGGIKALYE
jgi:hypothetical protein